MYSFNMPYNIKSDLLKKRLARMPGVLSQRERTIVTSHFLENDFYTTIAKRYGVTPVRVRQIAMRALWKLERLAKAHNSKKGTGN